MTPSLKWWPTKAKEALSPHEVKLAPLDTKFFKVLGMIIIINTKEEIAVFKTYYGIHQEIFIRGHP